MISHGYVSLPEGKCLLMVNMMIDQSMELIMHPQKMRETLNRFNAGPSSGFPLASKLQLRLQQLKLCLSPDWCWCHPWRYGWRRFPNHVDQ